MTPTHDPDICYLDGVTPCDACLPAHRAREERQARETRDQHAHSRRGELRRRLADALATMMECEPAEAIETLREIGGEQ